MKNNIIQSEMDVKGSRINVIRVDGYEYISLTDLARTQNDEAPADVVKNFNKSSGQNAETSAPAPIKDKAPIPMAVPESLR